MVLTMAPASVPDMDQMLESSKALVMFLTTVPAMDQKVGILRENCIGFLMMFLRRVGYKNLQGLLQVLPR